MVTQRQVSAGGCYCWPQLNAQGWSLSVPRCVDSSVRYACAYVCGMDVFIHVHMCLCGILLCLHGYMPACKLCAYVYFCVHLPGLGCCAACIGVKNCGVKRL